jgi:hypothetical protein
MPLIDPEEFGDREPVRVFIASTMAEARAAEALLTDSDIRYVVEAEPLGRTLFGLPRHWAVFYVLAEDADVCVSLLVRGGLECGVVKPGGP